MCGVPRIEEKGETKEEKKKRKQKQRIISVEKRGHQNIEKKIG